MKKLILLIFMMLLVSCNPNNELKNTGIDALEIELEVKNETEKRLEKQIDVLEVEIEALNETIIIQSEDIKAFELNIESLEETLSETSSTTLLEVSLEVMTLIENQDFSALASYVDPTLGLRFSPYSYINVSTDLWFTPIQVSNLSSDPTIYTWGNYDGSGDPITYDFLNYYNEFVYDHNFLTPHLIGNNTVIGTGNMINNLNSVYPTASFVEFNFTGFNPAYSGMDWSSLRLIFENVSGTWKLININHGQWTI